MKKKDMIFTLIAVLLIASMNLMAQEPVFYEEFDAGLGTWWIGFQDGEAEGTSYIEDAKILSGENSLTIEIYNGGSSGWHIQVLNHLTLEKDKSYDVWFMAATDAVDPISCDIIWSLPVDPWTNYKTFTNKINPDPETYGPFTWVCKADSVVDLKFWLGNNDPTNVYMDSIVVVETPTEAVDGFSPAAIPDGFALEQNYPNPFNPVTSISYRLAEPSGLKLEVYNIQGQLVRTLFNGQCNAGQHRVTWNGLDMDNQPVSSGIYIYRMDAQGVTRNFSSSNKMFLIK